MTQQEFERRIGKSVSTTAYAMYEKIYMAAGNMDKDEFCKAVKGIKPETLSLINVLENELEVAKHQNSVALAELEKETEIKTLRCRELEEATAESKKWYNMLTEARTENLELAKALIACGHENNAVEIIGRAAVIAIKAKSGIEFNECDLAFIAETFSK